MGAGSKKSVLWDKKTDYVAKLEYLVKELTIDEKLQLLSSGSGGVERLGIPQLRLGGEAAHGVEARNDQNGIGTPDKTTSFPQPIGMSSSWDKQAIKKAGEITGKEARLVYNRHPWGGISRWAPTVDLLRDPRWGRNEEAYGEDPVQVGNMSAEYVKGIQGDDKEHLMTASTLKHFYANNTEMGRIWKNASISPRNKYELYLEPFRRCIEDGGAEGVMTAYNRINGVQGLFNEDVKTILKDEYGLVHAVSDGGAAELSASMSHSTAMDAETIASSIKAGVDALSGRPDFIYASAKEAYEMGLLSEEDIDTAIKNVYSTKIRLGLFENNKYDIGELCSEESSKACKDLTDRSLVLLKNDGVLPLTIEQLKDAVVIGPVGDKWYMDWYGGAAPEKISLFDGLNEIYPGKKGSKLNYIDACDRVTFECDGKYLAADSKGRVKLSDKPDVFVLEDWGEGSYTLRNEKTGKYMQTKLEEKVIAGSVYADLENTFTWFNLEVFRIKKMRSKTMLSDRFGNALYADKKGFIVSAKEDSKSLTKLTFTMHTLRNGLKEAIDAASKAKLVILALGHNPMINARETIDRESIDFIPYQQKLFDEVYKVNKNVIASLISDYPFAINEIDKKARAILLSSTGSQCMGRSIADAMTGKVHPAGRLTQTWYKSNDDLIDIDDYDIIGKGRTYRYFEGKVLYPFGFGLTYTSFEYKDIRISVSHTAKAKTKQTKKVYGQPNGVYDALRKDDRVLNVELTVKNTGKTTSDEVVQIYARKKKSKAPEKIKRPLQALIGFERVRDIAPGKSKKVKIKIPVRELAVYDVVSESLIIEDGEYEIKAAASCLDKGVCESIKIDGAVIGLRDLSNKIKADHYDSQAGSQIVEGLYGYSALMAESAGVYEPPKNGHFTAVYNRCDIPAKTDIFRIHGYAPGNAKIKVFIDNKKSGELTFNTRDYEKMPGDDRNRMPRAVEDAKKRRESYPTLWADIRIKLDAKNIKKTKNGHTIRIEADGPFKYDWFSMTQDK